MREKNNVRYIFESIFELLLVLLAIVPWIAGIVLAPSGGPDKLFACFCPPVAWYHFAEKVMQLIGWI